MRYCHNCGEPIPAHTVRKLTTMESATIVHESRNPQTARANARRLARDCPLVRLDDGTQITERVNDLGLHGQADQQEGGA